MEQWLRIVGRVDEQTLSRMHQRGMTDPVFWLQQLNKNSEDDDDNLRSIAHRCCHIHLRLREPDHDAIRKLSTQLCHAVQRLRQYHNDAKKAKDT